MGKTTTRRSIFSMKKINDFIVEKFKINSKTVKPLSRQLIDDWSIENAEDGDIVNSNDGDLYFIYKCLNTNKKYGSLSEDSIIYHVVYSTVSSKLIIGPDYGIGTLRYHSPMKLATLEECENLFKVLEKNNLEWDEKNKKLIKK